MFRCPSTRPRVLAAAVPAAILLTTMANPSTASAETLSRTESAHAAAHFLAAQLAAGGDRIQTSFDGTAYDDYGLTIDTILGLDSTGYGAAQADRSTAWIAAHVKDYTTYGQDIYAGPTAKALLLAATQGKNPESFGGVNLVTTLQGLQTPSGRFSDKTSSTDYSSTMSQSLAIIALAKAGAPVSDAAGRFLVAQQCKDGGFRLDPGAKDCVSDPDVTAVAIDAAMSAGGRVDANAVATAGLHYLAGRQGADGGIGGVGPTVGENSNTTGLAASVFAAGHADKQYTKAATFLTGLQFGCAVPEPLRGAIAYDAASFKDTVDAGAKATVADTQRRTTAQAILGLSGKTYRQLTASTNAGIPALPTCSSPTSSATPTSTVTGPPVITDGPRDTSGWSTLVPVGALGGAAAVAALAFVRTKHVGRRSAGRKSS